MNVHVSGARVCFRNTKTLAFPEVKGQLLPLVGNCMEEADKDKRKGGCPMRGITQRKQRVVSIRFSEVEYYAIKRRASLAGMTVSAYSHSAILNGKVVEPVKKEDMDLLRKLSGEANNLNQIAHKANTYRMPYLEKEVKNVLNLVTEIINKLSNDWKNNKGKKL